MINNIKILGINYKIVEKTTREVFGEIDYNSQEILLSEGMTIERLRETLLHEVIHGVLAALGFEKETTDEQFVTSFSSALADTLTNNQSFVKLFISKRGN